VGGELFDDFLIDIRGDFSTVELFFVGEGVRFGEDESVVFLVNNCLITDVRLLLVVGFSSSCFLFIFSFDGDKSLFDSFVDVFIFY